MAGQDENKYILDAKEAEQIASEQGAAVVVNIIPNNEGSGYIVDTKKPVVVMTSASVPNEGYGLIKTFKYKGAEKSVIIEGPLKIENIDDIKGMLGDNKELNRLLDAITPESNDTTAVDEFMSAASVVITDPDKQKAVREFLEKHIKPLGQGGSKKHRKSRRRADKRGHKKVRKSMHRRRQ